MIHEVGRDMLALLQTRGVPFPVFDGQSPEARPTSTFARERIVIEHDFDGGDQVVAPRGARQATVSGNAPPIPSPGAQVPVLWNVLTGVKVTIYAKATRVGALYWEHVRRVEQVRDHVLCCLKIVSTQRSNVLAFKTGRLIRPKDLEDSETPGGAAYELFFTFDRGVYDQMWSGTTETVVAVTPQMIGAPGVTFAATAHTITRSFGSFLQDGFQVGQSVIITGSTSNNGTFGPITGLTDTVMTIASAGLTNEAPDTSVTITGTGVVLNSTTVVSEPNSNTTETACGNGGT